MAKAKRLSKVAREFNIGINTIIEFLSEKGYDVDAKPNTKIEPEIYEVLVDEFQSEKSAKEESKQVSIGGKTEEKAVSIEEVDKDEDKSKDSDEEVLIKNVQTGAAADISDADEEEEKKEEKEEKAEENGEEDEEVKVVGKIDLDSMNMKTRPDSKKKKEEEEAKKKEEESREEKEKAESRKKKEKEDKKEEEDKDKEKEGDKPGDEDIRVDVEKLDGPKVVGKIDLPEKKKPVASSSDDASDRKKKKRKRKRIRKKSEAVDPKSASKKGKRRKQKKDDKPEVTEEEIQKEIKETLARLTGGGKSKSAKYRRQKREEQKQQQQEEQEKLEEQQKTLTVAEFVTANELANMMDVDVNEVIAACMDLGMFVSINQRLDAETITIVAEEFGYDVEFVSAEEKVDVVEKEDKPEDLQPRPPVVTVMGHVDHGKTSLLDHIRQANVIAGEAGGITQHIGAYNVELPDKRTITFLDTPGHEAFTAMRARGAQVTDVAIIIIAADDNVMPQTKEAINHAQAAGVPIVFAINKIDKPNANPDKVKEELSQMNILVEDWGGKYQCQEISAKKGTNVDELLEKVLLEAELLDVKANPDKNANGTVIESMLDKGRGYVATLLVQTGTMKVGDVVLAGCYSGRVKAMFNERGQKINDAGPSIPVSMLGLDGAPTAGDKFNVMDDEREAREIADRRTQLQREQGVRTQKHITLDEIGRRIAVGDFQELNIIVKGDVDGSIEALSDSLLKLSTGQIQVNIIHKSVGQITESDVMLAAASDAIIVGFQVRPSVTARKVAEREQIDIRLYSIIYDAVEEIRSAMEGMLAPKVEENVVATLEIRETFKISKVGTIAGCMVQDGKISRNNKVRLIREGIVVYDGELGSLKRFKDDVKEVAAGYECGLNIENYNDIKVGDVIEAYEEVEVKQTLE